MKTIHQVCELTGLTPRTLHHYDTIGLLKPAKVTGAGYRLYDDWALARLQAIMLFRELEFPLKDIKAILDDPSFEQQEALEQQIRLLELRQEHLGRLIQLARTLQKEETIMDFQVFDHKEIDQYAQEVKERWGGTASYAESKEKLKGKSKAETDAMGAELMAILKELGMLRDQAPDSPAVQEKVGTLQTFITEHYYHCTDEILVGLGEMYTGDERMRGNIDRACGEGAAAFAAQAIAAYANK